mmetsp:Transcript_40136/g.92228  ORF Transcript_40136/g.92228 Transcript_40136/m.92228 type:complete len:213 (-) Transcript_40136:673-1311(-)
MTVGASHCLRRMLQRRLASIHPVMLRVLEPTRTFQDPQQIMHDKLNSGQDQSSHSAARGLYIEAMPAWGKTSLEGRRQLVQPCLWHATPILCEQTSCQRTCGGRIPVLLLQQAKLAQIPFKDAEGAGGDAPLPRHPMRRHQTAYQKPPNLSHRCPRKPLHFPSMQPPRCIQHYPGQVLWSSSGQPREVMPLREGKAEECLHGRPAWPALRSK